MTAISYHDTVKELQGLDWQGAGPFARLEWFALLENAGHQPFFAQAADANGALCLPLERSESGLKSLTNWYAFTCDLLKRGVQSENLLRALAGDLASKTHRIALSKLDEPFADALASAFSASGWRVWKAPCDTNHILPVQGRSFAEYLAARPGPLRTTLKRKARKVEVSLSTQFSAADWADYEDIYADSWKPQEGDPALLRQFAELESEAGRFRFAIARQDGAPVAAQFWTVDLGTAYIHKLAHRSSSEKLSPGTTLTAALMEHVIDTDKVSLVDFGTGDDGYKRDWMEQVRIRWELTALRPANPRNWPLMVKTGLRGISSKLVSRESAG